MNIHLGDDVVLKHKDSGIVVCGVATRDWENSLGSTAIFKLERVIGLPVETAEFNSNFWTILSSVNAQDITAEQRVLTTTIRDLLRKMSAREKGN